MLVAAARPNPPLGDLSERVCLGPSAGAARGTDEERACPSFPGKGCMWLNEAQDLVASGATALGRCSKVGGASAERRPHVDGWIRCPRRAGAMTYRRFEGPGRNVYRVPEYLLECVQQSWQKPRATVQGSCGHCKSRAISGTACEARDLRTNALLRLASVQTRVTPIGLLDPAAALSD